MPFGSVDLSTSSSPMSGLQGFSLPPDPYSPAYSLSGSDSNSSGSYSSGKPSFSPSPFGRPPSRGSDRSLSSSSGSGRGGSVPFRQTRGPSRSFNPSQLGGGGGGSSSFTSAQPGSSTPAASRRRGQPQLPTDIPNENEYMLRQAHETGNFGPTSLPPQPYSGQSPFDKPKQTPPKILQSQMDYLDDVNRRVNAVDDRTQRIVQERGQRAIQNASMFPLLKISVPITFADLSFPYSSPWP